MIKIEVMGGIILADEAS